MYLENLHLIFSKATKKPIKAVIKKSLKELAVVAHACNCSTREAKARMRTTLPRV